MFPVLMYHAASELTGRFRRLGVPPARLREQLEALASDGYALLGLTEALARAEQGTADRFVALTFDDAYVDFATAVVPLLEELGARATLYVPTGHVGERARWLGAAATDLPRLLDWGQLVGCAGSGAVEIGSHSHTHPQMDTLAPAAAACEVEESRRLLEQRLGVPVASFCYPNGYHSEAVRALVRDAGYDNACEVGRRLRSPAHRWALSRLAVGPEHTAARLLRELRTGGPVLVPAAKRALQPAWRQVRRGLGVARPARLA